MSSSRNFSSELNLTIVGSVALNGGDAAILYGQQVLLEAAFSDSVIRTTVYELQSQAQEVQQYYPDFRFSNSLYNSSVTREYKNRRLNRLSRHIRKKRLRSAVELWSQGRHRTAKAAIPMDKRRTLNSYIRADLMVSTGGTYLTDNYSLEPRMIDYEIALAANVPLIFFTQSLGPFTRSVHRERLSRIFNRSVVTIVRDEESRAHLTDIGVSGDRIAVRPDAAFALPRPRNHRGEPDRNVKGNDTPKVAVSVREWKYFKARHSNDGMEQYRRAIAALTTTLVCERSVQVTFVSTCQGRPEYRYDDSVLAAEIVKTLSPEVQRAVTVDRRPRQPIELQEYLTQFEIAICTRMHMAILSLNAGVPVLPIAYEFKTKALFQSLGMEHWVQDIETTTQESLPAVALQFIDSRESLVPALLRQVEELRERCFEM